MTNKKLPEKFIISKALTPSALIFSRSISSAGCKFTAKFFMADGIIS